MQFLRPIWTDPRTVVFAGLFAVALVAGAFSFYSEYHMRQVMGPFQDCSGIDTFPLPSTCADSHRMASYENLRARSQVSEVVSLIFFVGSVFGAVFFHGRGTGNEHDPGQIHFP